MYSDRFISTYKNSSASVDDISGVVEGDSSDIENFRHRLRGEDDRGMISEAISAEIDKSKFAATFSSDNTSNVPLPSGAPKTWPPIFFNARTKF